MIAAADGNTVVRFEIQRGTNALGSVDVELFDADKPETVRNFLLYVWSGAYSNTFLHRAVPSFIVQGGGFAITNPMATNRFSSYLEVTNYGRLTNEFLVGPRLSNTFGTIAMAKVAGDTNSASSQWFFNLTNNAGNLDNQNGGFTVFGRILESTNANEGASVLQHFNTLSITNGIVNLGALLGGAYNVFSSLPVSYTVTNRAPSYQELYHTRISVLNRSNVTGVLPPTVSIVSPGPDSRFTNGTVTVSGTAADDGGIARVIYRLEGGLPEIATGTTNWEFSVRPRSGFNTLSVQSIDWQGNYSTNAALTFFYTVQVPLDLQKVGQGTIEGLYDGQLLQLGRYYTVSATPAAGYRFGGWSGSVVSNTPTLTFLVPTNATNFTLTANFLGSPFIGRAGTYHGLFRSRAVPNLRDSGFMNLTLQTNGSFEGNILHRGGTYNFTGQFNNRGEASLQGTVGGTARFVALQLDITNTAGVITGGMSPGDVEVRLERLASTLPTPDPPLTGSYTFALPDISTNPPSQLKPGGFGYGTASIGGNGLLRFSGRFADGRTFTNSAKMTRARHWPIYVNFLNGRGVFLGWLSYPTNQTSNLDGTLQWVKGADIDDSTYPAGFATTLLFLGSKYPQLMKDSRVLSWVHGLARIDGADLLVGVTNLLKLTTGNELIPAPPNPSGLSLSLDAQTGLVDGTFTHPWAGTVSRLRGIVIPRTHNILGQFIDGQQTGRLIVEVSPFLVTQSVVNVTMDGLTAALSEGGLLRFETGGVINVTSPLSIKYHTTLDANGHRIVLDGGGTNSLFTVATNVNFAAKGIVFANGRHMGGAGTATDPNGADAYGAGILNRGGSIALTNCVMTNFVVAGGPAANTTNSLGSGGRGYGAAICNLSGKVTLQGCEIVDSFAEGGWSVSNAVSTLLPISPGVAMGAGLYSDGGQCEVFETTFLRNRARGGHTQGFPGGSGIHASDAAGGAIALNGGRLRSRLLRFTSNVARGGRNLAFSLQPSAFPVAGGEAHGGALFVATNAEAVVEQSTFDLNSARGGGGTAAKGRGGALASSGRLTVNACTFNDNLAEGGVAAGGAIYSEIGALTATNSTWAFNQAAVATNLTGSVTNTPGFGESQGGALMVVSNTGTLVNLTVAYNSASGLQPSGGAIANRGAAITLRNSIVSSNGPSVFSGGISDGGFNLSSDDTSDFTSPSSRVRTNPLLGPLIANGGPTHTMAILPTSPAVNILTNNFPSVDQRGIARPQPSGATNRADIGAFEYMQTLPSFTLSPAGGTFRYGTNVTLQVAASGPTPIRFFWLKDGSLLSGATNSFITFTSVQPGDAGSYAAVATNSFGAVTSIVATIVVDSRPVLVGTEPRDITVAPGGTTNFAVVVNGPALTYLWTHDGVLLPSATNATLTISNASPGVQGTYQVVATNFAGAVTSRVARLTFSGLALSIVNQPQDLSVAEGDPAYFQVLVSGVPPFSFQWRFGNNSITDATNQALDLISTSLTNAGTYRVVVTNAYLSVTSAPAVLTVISPPLLSIAATPTNVLITASGNTGRVHRLLYATNLLPGQIWTPVATNTLPSSGKFTWPRPFPTNTPAYYRAVTP